MISEIVIVSIGVAIVALAITAALSPLETLSWWAGWTEQDLSDPPPAPADGADNRSAPFVVYLSGVASISGEHLLRRERIFIDSVRTRLPHAIIIDDVFPYSPSGLPLLASPRLFDRLWRWLQKLDLQKRGNFLRGLINIRNIYQVLVSADHRYGPIFSQGAARAIVSALYNAGFRPGSGAPIVIVGYSGGAQVAVGAAPFLKAWCGAPINVISIGGVLASDPGIAAVDTVHHFRGENDRIEKLGALMFAERWPTFANSRWNEAKRDGRLVVHHLTDMGHAGPAGYFGLPRRGGQSNNERMTEAVAGVFSSLGAQ